MKIAIISNFSFHFECLGFLLEILKNNDITLYYNNYNHNWIDYFKQLYNFKCINNLNININDYAEIIKLSSNDDVILSENVTSLLHEYSLKDIGKKYISLTPYINGENIYYMFPIFKPNNVPTTENIITLIGYYLNNNIDEDTNAFIENNLDYQFLFITWGDNNYSNLSRHTNVKVLHNVNTFNLIEIVNRSKYILSKKFINYDRFSGQLGLAMSFEKPMIIDSKTADAYKLPGVLFENGYNEIGKLSNILDERYNSLIQDIKIFNKNCLNNNAVTIKKLFKNTVLLVEPRILDEIPILISQYHAYLPDWNFVFYCGKDTKTHWQNVLEDYVELRELDVTNFNASGYSYFLKKKELWESLYGDFVLTIQADTMIMSIEPYNINYFINLNKSYIGGNMNFKWNELNREGIEFKNYNFNGGLSLRKREDMIKVINHFPPILFNDATIYSPNVETDPEDVYFTIGCHKLGLSIGDDEESTHFAIHKIFKNGFFGFHQPENCIKNVILEAYPALKNTHLFY